MRRDWSEFEKDRLTLMGLAVPPIRSGWTAGLRDNVVWMDG